MRHNLHRFLRRTASAVGLIERLFALRERYARPSLAQQGVCLQVVALEDRTVPSRPLPIPMIYTGTGQGPPPVVRSFDAVTGEMTFERTVSDSSFAGGVRVATADITGDGFPDLVTALGPGGQRVQVLDGKTSDPVAGKLGSFLPYGSGFAGGVVVAAADVDGDGTPDVITGAGAGGGPHVKVFSGADGALLLSFFAFESDFKGGVSIAAADFTGDGKAELVVGAGVGGGPRVRVFDLTTGGQIAGPLGSFYAFDPSHRSGANVGADWRAGDVDGDGVPDLIVGTGAGVASEVKVFSGADGSVLMDLAPFAASMTAGVTVAAAYVDDDAHADVVIATGSGVTATVRVYSGADGQLVDLPTAEFQPFGPSMQGGVNLAASNDPPPITPPPVPPSPPSPPPPYGISEVWFDPASQLITEGTSGDIWLHRSGGDITQPLDVRVSIEVDGAGDPLATWDTDYTLTVLGGNGSSALLTSAGGIVTFGPNETVVDLGVAALTDNVVENVEGFRLAIPVDIRYQAGSAGEGGSPTSDLQIADPARIGDQVWLDEDEDGVQDTGEAGMEGVTVRLHHGGAVVSSTVTDSEGRYRFEGLVASGMYQVEFVNPDATIYAFTQQDIGSDDTDSDADEAGFTAPFTVSAGVTDDKKDAGMVEIKIKSVTWVQKAGATGAPLDDQPAGTPGGGRRAYPEAKTPGVDPADEVDIRVELNVKKAGQIIDLYVFDVDDPSSNEAVLDDESKTTDNRGDGLNTGAGKLAPETTDANGVVVFSRSLSGQPGDNYRAVASIIGGTDIPGDYARVRQDDGGKAQVYLLVQGKLTTTPVPTENAKLVTSPLLTVWRHLTIERDHMAAPPAGEVFDATEPRKDVDPGGAIPDLDISQVQSYFRAAYIETRDAGALNKMSEVPWTHIWDTEANYALGIDALAKGVRDVANSDYYWSVRAIAAYEAFEADDYDPPAGAPGPLNPGGVEGWLAGATRAGGTATSFVFTEVVRDTVAAGRPDSWEWDKTKNTWVETKSSYTINHTVAEDLKRTTYHEVLHNFDLEHNGIPGNPGDQGILDNATLSTGDATEIKLNPPQLSKVRGVDKPE